MERIIASEGHLSFEARVQFTRAANDALESRGQFHIAVPGGSVASLVFPGWAEAAVDWTRIHVWWVDERDVPKNHADSNYRLAHEAWLSKVPAVAHPFDSVAEYQSQLPHPLDAVLLGVGPDGHVASLFPGHAGLRQTERAFEVVDAPKPPPRRRTLSLTEICAAREVWVLATGITKAQMLMKALKPDSQLPLAHVLRTAPEVRLWVDAAAASYL